VDHKSSNGKIHYFDLRCVDDFSQRPHQSSVNPHQLLGADLVRLVQDHPHFVLVVLQRSDDLGELVRDVQLVSVEQEDDAVDALCKPLQHCGEVVTWGERRRDQLVKDGTIDTVVPPYDLHCLKIYIYTGIYHYCSRWRVRTGGIRI